MADKPLIDPPLLVVWHSRTGASKRMASAVAEAAGEGAKLITAEQAAARDFLAAQGYVFVCPENLGSMSGMMKEMFDRLYYPLLGQIEGRAYASIIAAGSDGYGADRQLDRIVTGWRLKRVTDNMVVNFAAQTPEAILAPKYLPLKVQNKCSEMGAGLVEGLRSGIF